MQSPIDFFETFLCGEGMSSPFGQSFHLPSQPATSNSEEVILSTSFSELYTPFYPSPAPTPYPSPSLYASPSPSPTSKVYTIIPYPFNSNQMPSPLSQPVTLIPLSHVYIPPLSLEQLTAEMLPPQPYQLTEFQHSFPLNTSSESDPTPATSSSSTTTTTWTATVTLDLPPPLPTLPPSHQTVPQKVKSEPSTPRPSAHPYAEKTRARSHSPPNNKSNPTLSPPLSRSSTSEKYGTLTSQSENFASSSLPDPSLSHSPSPPPPARKKGSRKADNAGEFKRIFNNYLDADAAALTAWTHFMRAHGCPKHRVCIRTYLAFCDDRAEKYGDADPFVQLRSNPEWHRLGSRTDCQCKSFGPFRSIYPVILSFLTIHTSPPSPPPIRPNEAF